MHNSETTQRFNVFTFSQKQIRS